MAGFLLLPLISTKDTQTEQRAKHLMEKLKRNPRQVEMLREKAPEVQKGIKK